MKTKGIYALTAGLLVMTGMATSCSQDGPDNPDGKLPLPSMLISAIRKPRSKHSTTGARRTPTTRLPDTSRTLIRPRTQYC